MPLDPNADAEITAFRWVPPFAAGLVRDLRIRWALEEIERPYRVRLLDALHPRPHEYFAEQPFGQVPAYRDKDVQLFESGAILIHLGINDERLMPTERNARMRAVAWLIAALNSVEPAFFELISIDIFNKGEAWTKERRPQVVERIQARLALLAEALGDQDWFEGSFSIGNLMMASVLRNLRHTDLVA
jgi:glutathione S-transferase